MGPSVRVCLERWMVLDPPPLVAPPPRQPPATPAVRRTSPTIVSTPNAIVMTLASGDEYSDEEENIHEVALDVSTSFLC